MTALIFEGYRVTKMSYTKNETFSNTDKITYIPSFNSTIKLNEETDEATVTLAFHTNKEFPFELSVKMEGDFKYNNAEDPQEIGFAHFLRQNATAIMFPYLRVIVSQLSGLGNEYPSLLLPTVNISKLLQNEDED